MATAHPNPMLPSSSSDGGGLIRPLLQSRGSSFRLRRQGSSSRLVPLRCASPCVQRKGEGSHEGSCCKREEGDGGTVDSSWPPKQEGEGQAKSGATFDSPDCFICLGGLNPGSDESIRLPCGNCRNTGVHIKCIYEWTIHQDGDVKTCPLCRGPLGNIDYHPEDCIKAQSLVLSGARRSFVMRPLPTGLAGGMLRCYVKVLPDSFGSTRYEFWLQGASTRPYPLGPQPSRSPAPGDVPLLYARHRGRRLGCLGLGFRSLLDISLHKGSEGSRKYSLVASLKASAAGLEHTLTAPLAVQGGAGERELCAVAYEQNRFGLAVGPRKMRICMPEVDEEDANNIPLFRPTRSSDTMVAQLRGGEDSAPNLRFMANKEPQWVEELGAHTLDFSGRVNLASSKNFQLIQSGSSLVLMQFGKVLEEPNGVYSCDFRWPISPLQAFGICISSCIRKAACS